MKNYPFGPGLYAVNQLADELVAAGVPMGGGAYIGRDGFPVATMITVVANDSAVDEVVNATVSAHVPIGFAISTTTEVVSDEVVVPLDERLSTLERQLRELLRWNLETFNELPPGLVDDFDEDPAVVEED